jgi:hypothetical protein
MELEKGNMLSDLIIPLTELERTTPPIKNSVSKKGLNQTIDNAKTYSQKLGRILYREVIIKVKNHSCLRKEGYLKKDPF